MSHYRNKGNSLVQDCQINDRSNLQSKAIINFKIISTYIVDQSPPRKLKYMFNTDCLYYYIIRYKLQ